MNYRDKKSFGRKKGKKERNSILIVCEGEATEPIYYHFFRKENRLSTDIVDIYGKECGTNPLTVVNFAIDKSKEKKGYEKYKAVYCVFDVDTHEHISQAIQLAKSHEFIPVISNICFEYWLFLHIKSYNRAATCCDELESEIKKEITTYEKSNKEVIEKLAESYDEAVERVRLIKTSRDWSNLLETNPSTNAFIVVEAIKLIKIIS